MAHVGGCCYHGNMETLELIGKIIFVLIIWTPMVLGFKELIVQKQKNADAEARRNDFSWSD